MKSSTKKKKTVIGTNRKSGKFVYMDMDDFQDRHAHILGATGMGKTFFLDYLMRMFVKRGYGICLIDPLGGLYKRMLKFAVDRRLEDRTILIDPNDINWAVGLNMLEFDPGSSSVSAHVEQVRNELALVLGEDTGEFKPQHDRWVRNAVTLLTEARLSMFELMDVAEPIPEDAVLRKRILAEHQLDIVTRREWERFEKLPGNERSTLTASIMNRGNPFSTPHTRLMFGQQKSTIDFREAMDTGKLVLVNLNADAISEQEQRMLGVEVIYKIMRAARGRKTKRPFFVFIDEFGSLVSQQVADALDTMRQLGVFFYLSHQRLEQLRQLRDGGDNLYSATMGGTRLKFIFRVIEPDPAEEMARLLFAGQITGDKIKRIMYRTLFAPRTEWMDITSHTAGSSSGGGAGSSRGGASGSTSVYGGASHYGVGEGLFAGPDLIGTVDSTSSVSANSEHWADSETSFWSDIDATTTTSAPVTVFDREKEISSIETYTLEEMRQQFADQIMLQDIREMFFKFEASRPIPLITPTVDEVRVRKVDVEAFKKVVYSKYARPAVEVRQEIEERHKRNTTATEEEKLLWGTTAQKALPKRKTKPVKVPNISLKKTVIKETNVQDSQQKTED